MKKVLLAVASMLLLTAGMAFAEDGGLEIGLDYRFRLDSLKGTVHDYIDTGNRAPAQQPAPRLVILLRMTRYS